MKRLLKGISDKTCAIKWTYLCKLPLQIPSPEANSLHADLLKTKNSDSDIKSKKIRLLAPGNPLYSNLFASVMMWQNTVTLGRMLALTTSLTGLKAASLKQQRLSVLLKGHSTTFIDPAGSVVHSLPSLGFPLLVWALNLVGFLKDLAATLLAYLHKTENPCVSWGNLT